MKNPPCRKLVLLGAAVLILQNTSGSDTSASSTETALAGAHAAAVSPASKLRAVAENDAARSLLAATGEPIPVCMHDFLSRRTREMRNRMKEAGHGR